MSEGSKPEVREYPGCGCGGPPVQLPAPQPVQLQQAAASPGPSTIGISITPTTGGQFDISVDRAETVDNLKKIISKRLKVAKERICLLHRDRQLRDGTLEENRLQDGSRLTLLPSVETGLLAQRPEQSVMQALESLSDSQVNDFLSGKAPLNLTMRLGDHMMLIQLQLSTVTPANGGANAQPASSNTSPTLPAATRPTTPPATLSHPTNEIDNSCPRRSSSVVSSLPSRTPPGSPSPSKLSLSSSLVGSNSNSSSSSSLSPGPSLFSTPSPSPPSTPTSPCSPPSSSPPRQQQQQQQHRHSSRHRQLHHPARARYTHQHYQSPQQRAAYVRKIGTATRSSCPTCAEAEPTSSSTTSTTTTTTTTTTTKQQPAAPEPMPTSTKCSEFSLILSQQCDCSKSSTSPKKPCPSHATATSTEPQQQQQQQQQPHPQQLESSSPESSTPPTPTSPTNPDGSDFAAGAEATANPTATLDTRALVEASRNLTQKLKQLSSEENAKRRQGAIIESMHHHGKGVYTGTFSGTLNPALQDRHGRPKRDISTIIHILNDLLCATPATAAGHYRYHRHQSAASHRASASSAAASAAAAQPTAPQQPTAQAVAEQPCSQDSANPRFSGDVQNDELFKENETTKSKMRRLRLVLEQRREKMRARRQARAAPYTTKWAAVTPDADSNAAGSNSPGEAQNEPELQPCSPEPVVA